MLTKSSADEAAAKADAAALESVKGLADEEKSHPRDLSSCRMSRRIISSGTRAPERMAVSARIPGARLLAFLRSCYSGEYASAPRGVLFFTLSRSKSPELIAESWGKRWRSRSACVPFPTPGAPTRMMRAAFLRRIFVIFLFF